MARHLESAELTSSSLPPAWDLVARLQSRTQSPLAFWSADGRRPSADQKARGLWVRDWRVC